MNRLPTVILNENTLWMKDVALRQPCRAVDVNNPEDLALAQDVIPELFRSLYADPSGVAIAAPQIGVLLQMTAIQFEDKDANEQRLLVLINPKITPLSEETNDESEICLSVPNYSGKVPRWNKIQVDAYNQHGEPINFVAEGFFARVIQHETDHLVGTLYIDKVKGELDQVPDFPERRTPPTIRKLGLSKKKTKQK
jgi:peptide deformylase